MLPTWFIVSADGPLLLSTPITLPITFPGFKSLNSRIKPGFAIAIFPPVSFVFFAVGVFFWYIGAWPVFGFLGLELGALVVLLNYHHKRSYIVERIAITADGVKVERIDSSGRSYEWCFQRHWLQVNVEEGRHLWAMVYLLQKYFGKDGREEADDLLVRSSGSDEAPRMLGAFNEETPDWLSFFMFTYFTDRDGKMQLESLAQSGFDPLSRTCRFMLTEEAHHMFVGETGVSRTIEATVNVMQKHGISDPYDISRVRSYNVIDLPTIQKKLNLHYSLSLDLFGQEVSTNAANAFNAGIKGRYMEVRINDDHQLNNDTYVVRNVVNNAIVSEEVPALTAINMRLRDDYVRDAAGGVGRWNKLLKKAGVDFEFALPHESFHRQIGVFSAIKASPEGDILSDAEWEKNCEKWLPNKEDGAYIQSLMKPCYTPGEYASWIAPPKVGIDNKPGDFEYVKLHMA